MKKMSFCIQPSLHNDLEVLKCQQKFEKQDYNFISHLYMNLYWMWLTAKPLNIWNNNTKEEGEALRRIYDTFLSTDDANAHQSWYHQPFNT